MALITLLLIMMFFFLVCPNDSSLLTPKFVCALFNINSSDYKIEDDVKFFSKLKQNDIIILSDRVSTEASKTIQTLSKYFRLNIWLYHSDYIQNLFKLVDKDKTAIIFDLTSSKSPFNFSRVNLFL